MSEDNDDESRLQKLSRLFGYTTRRLELDSGLVIGPTNLRSASYEVQHEEEGAVDVVDVDQFRSVRELDQYLQRFEGRAPDDLGHEVA